ncbi:MAG: PAS domain-containing sensor histidine kinase [Ferruginibacter sp.]|nr:PAS domain-containing sensor histidine kinase [Cytophagales bacterium]
MVTTIFPIKNDEGVVTNAVIQHEDVTQQRRAQEALQAGEERYRAFVQQSSEAIWRFELDAAPIDIRLPEDEQIALFYQNAYLAECNDTMARMYGFSSAGEILGAPLGDLLPRSEPANLNYLRAFIRSGYRLSDAESTEPDQQGNVRYFLSNLTGFVQEGKVFRAWGTQRDITDRKKAEEAQRESEARLRFALETGQLGAWDLDIQTGKANQSLLHDQAFGYATALDDWNYDAFLQHVHPEDRPGVDAKFQRALSEGTEWDFETRIVWPDQSIHWIWARGSPYKDARGRPLRFIGVVQNITARKKAEEEVAESAERFRRLLESIPQMAWTARPEGPLNYYNQRWYDYTGQTPEESLGDGWKPIQHPEDVLSSLEKWAHSVATGATYTQENRFLRAADQTYRWHLTRAVPIRNEEGEITLWVGTCTDIHDQKTVQEELVEAQRQVLQTNDDLNQTNRELRKINEDLDNFVYTASHDLKSPIVNLEGFVSLLQKRMSGKVDITEQRIMDMMNHSVNKFKQTIRDLTEIAKAQKTAEDGTEALSFREVLTDVQNDIVVLLWESNAHITTDFEVDKVYYARKNLRSILYNLISNAIKYHSPERPSEVSLKTRLVDRPEGGFVCLSVRDNGLGIAVDQLPKLFRMFKRLHSHVEGTGIGLYIVKRIVENNGGSIEVKSELGKGTTFNIYLPLFQEA